MKDLKSKHIIILLTIISAYLSCRKEESAPFPAIAIKGETSLNIPVQKNYIDSGLTITGDSNTYFVDTISNLRTDSIGEYYYRYVVTNKDGDYQVFNREIFVEIQLANLLGKFAVSETVTSGPSAQLKPYVYDLTILPYNNEPNKVQIPRFGGWTTKDIAILFFNEDGELNIPPQPFAGGNLVGDGQMKYDGREFKITYEFDYGDGNVDVAEFTATK